MSLPRFAFHRGICLMANMIPYGLKLNVVLHVIFDAFHITKET